MKNLLVALALVLSILAAIPWLIDTWLKLQNYIGKWYERYERITMSIKKLIVVILWAAIGLAINAQFDPNTVIGSVMGSAFIFIWIGLLVIGIFTWIKLNKK